MNKAPKGRAPSKPSTMSMSKHYHAGGKAGKSPRFRHQAKLEAERNEVKAKNRIHDPKSSVQELFKK